eukprot:TRINITY_DN2014_c0_g1_i1.p1 TRINITY_DN2014_c0_g1~~TRINITY_DN2014_c0_g1_i1.p1  ORF type:complete len:189 (-),score=23.10 TRINITY_DN2014_c0_g1_i1:189-755(-)
MAYTLLYPLVQPRKTRLYIRLESGVLKHAPAASHTATNPCSIRSCSLRYHLLSSLGAWAHEGSPQHMQYGSGGADVQWQARPQQPSLCTCNAGRRDKRAARGKREREEGRGWRRANQLHRTKWRFILAEKRYVTREDENMNVDPASVVLRYLLSHDEIEDNKNNVDKYQRQSEEHTDGGEERDDAALD